MAHQQHPVHGYCPECFIGHKVLGPLVGADGGSAGQRRFFCSQRAKKGNRGGCNFSEIIAPGAINTATGKGNCPECGKGALRRGFPDPARYTEQSWLCSRRGAREWPCSYEKPILGPARLM